MTPVSRMLARSSASSLALAATLRTLSGECRQRRQALPIQRLWFSLRRRISGGLRSWPWSVSLSCRTRMRLSLSFQARHPGFPFSGFQIAFSFSHPACRRDRRVALALLQKEGLLRLCELQRLYAFPLLSPPEKLNRRQQLRTVQISGAGVIDLQTLCCSREMSGFRSTPTWAERCRQAENRCHCPV